MNDYSTSEDLLNLIDKEISYNEEKQTRIKSAIIDSVESNGTVTLHIPPDSTKFSNIQNQSIYKLFPGMSVKILKESNISNNMWVIGVFNEKQAKKRFIEYLSPEELEKIQQYKTTETIIVSSCNGESGGDPGGGGEGEDDPGGGGGGEDDPGGGGEGEGGITEAEYKKLFFTTNERLSFNEYSTAGMYLNKKIYFSVPLYKPYGENVAGFTIENIGIKAILRNNFLLGENSGYADRSDFTVESCRNINSGVASFVIVPKYMAFSDDGQEDNGPIGLLINLTIKFGEDSYGYGDR